jgi:hypothetical protein
MDEPSVVHLENFSSWSTYEYFDWSAVCAPANSQDYIWVTCGLTIWNWQQSNSYPWTDPSGAVSTSSIAWAIYAPFEWDFEVDNT